MKKIIYCACAVALATACTNEDLTFDKVEAKKGITFEAAISDEVATRGAFEVEEENGTLTGHFFWFAEQDRINVYADNVNGVAATAEAVSDWATVSDANAAAYKATKSQRSAYFTSVSDAELLEFKNGNVVNFVATYPATTAISAATVNDDDVVTDINLSVGTTNVTQTVDFNEVASPMYAIGTGTRNADYESVGEKMGLTFKRPFPVLAFTSVEDNDAYNEYIGKLNSVSLTTKGGKKANNVVIAATNIAAESVTRAGVGSENPAAPILTSPSSTATVELETAALWESDDIVFMSILPVQRKQIVDPEDGTKKVDLEENYSVTYEYELVTLTKNLSTKKDWMAENATYAIEPLDIANDFSYIVTKDSKTLIVFSGDFADVFGEDDDFLTVAWNNTTVPTSSFNTIVSAVELTDDELETLKNFTSLTTLNLKEQKSICADVFDATLAAKITKLELPKVTSIDPEDNVAFDKLQYLDINSYKFAEDNVYKLFFNEDVAATLVTLKIEGLESLRPQFSFDRTIKFTNYAVLESVALNKTRVQLTTAAFQGCTSLETVTGIADIANAPSAFAQTTALKSINVYDDIIPNHAFEGSGIENVLLGGKQIEPKEVGEYAFNNATSIEVMNLSKATLIGKNAFSGATNFIGTKTNRNVVDLTVDVINDQILAGTKIVRVQFNPANATTLTLGVDIFGAAPALKQVKFVVPVNTNTDNDAFQSMTSLTAEGIDLFVVKGQTGVNGNAWTYTKTVTKAFKSITREDDPWVMPAE